MVNLVKRLDIVTSALNEEFCIRELYSRIDSVMENFPNYSWRLIICDNGSRDNTWKLIQEMSRLDSRILGVKLSKTFPLDSAYTCGLDLATGDAAIIMASDLQDPPEFIPELLKKFEEGFEQVTTKLKSRRRIPIVRRVLTYFFYGLADKLTQKSIPRGITDFRLLSKNAYEGSRSLRERNRFLRGLLTWSGYRTTTIEIERADRFAGESVFLSMSLSRVMKESVAAILAHTSAPLIWVSTLGGILSGLSLLSTIVFSISWITESIPFAGFGTIVGLISLGFSSLLFAVGVIAQYIALIYDEVKARPLYLVSEKTGQPNQ
jgi:glycosyltransferase involved in cell wall biosynthesis